MSVSPELRLTIQVATKAAQLPVDRAQLRRWVRAAAERPAWLTLRFVDLNEGRQLNRTYRRRADATNVLTFCYDDETRGRDRSKSAHTIVIADIVICMPVLRREARLQRKPLRDHLAHLVMHGVLHAQGYDHLGSRDAHRMESKEASLLARFRIADPYHEGRPVWSKAKTSGILKGRNRDLL